MSVRNGKLLPEKLYAALTTRERLGAYLAAVEREDQAERRRLAATAAPDFWPVACALCDLAQDWFLGLVEEAAMYRDFRDEAPDEFLALGYALRVRWQGWLHFCERVGVASTALLGGYPGYDRLTRTLAVAEQASLNPEGFLHWLNRRRPVGAPPRTELLRGQTPAGVADWLAGAFREAVTRHGGQGGSMASVFRSQSC